MPSTSMLVTAVAILSSIMLILFGISFLGGKSRPKPHQSPAYHPGGRTGQPPHPGGRTGQPPHPGGRTGQPPHPGGRTGQLPRPGRTPLCLPVAYSDGQTCSLGTRTPVVPTPGLPAEVKALNLTVDKSFCEAHKDATLNYLNKVYPTASSSFNKLTSYELAQFYNSLWFYYNCESSFDESLYIPDTTTYYQTQQRFCFNEIEGCGSKYPKLPYTPSEGHIYSFKDWVKNFTPWIPGDSSLPASEMAGSMAGETFGYWFNGPAPVWMYQRAVFRNVYDATLPTSVNVTDLLPDYAGTLTKVGVPSVYKGSLSDMKPAWNYPPKWWEGVPDYGYVEVTAASQPGMASSPPMIWVDGWPGSGLFIAVGKTHVAKNKSSGMFELAQMMTRCPKGGDTLLKWFGSNDPYEIMKRVLYSNQTGYVRTNGPTIWDQFAKKKVVNCILTTIPASNPSSVPVQLTNQGPDAADAWSTTADYGFWGTPSLTSANYYQWCQKAKDNSLAEIPNSCVDDILNSNTYLADRLNNTTLFDEPMFAMGMWLGLDTIQLTYSANGAGFWQCEILVLYDYPPEAADRDYSGFLEFKSADSGNERPDTAVCPNYNSGPTMGVQYKDNFVKTYINEKIWNHLWLRDPLDIYNDTKATQAKKGIDYPQDWDYNITASNNMSSMYTKMSIIGLPANQCTDTNIVSQPREQAMRELDMLKRPQIESFMLDPWVRESFTIPQCLPDNTSLVQLDEFYKAHAPATLAYLMAVYPMGDSLKTLNYRQLAIFYNSLWMYYNCEAKYDSQMIKESAWEFGSMEKVCWQELPSCGNKDFPKLPYSPQGFLYSFIDWVENASFSTPWIDSRSDKPPSYFTGSLPGKAFFPWYTGPAPMFMYQRAIYRVMSDPRLPENKTLNSMVKDPPPRAGDGNARFNFPYPLTGNGIGDITSYWDYPNKWWLGAPEGGYIEITGADEPGMALSGTSIWLDGWPGSGVFYHVGKTLVAVNKVDAVYKLAEKMGETAKGKAKLVKVYQSSDPYDIVSQVLLCNRDDNGGERSSYQSKVWDPVKKKSVEDSWCGVKGTLMGSSPQDEKGWQGFLYYFTLADWNTWCGNYTAETSSSYRRNGLPKKCIDDIRFARNYIANDITVEGMWDESITWMGCWLGLDTIQEIQSRNGTGFWQYEILELRVLPREIIAASRDYSSYIQKDGNGGVAWRPDNDDADNSIVKQIAQLYSYLSLRDPLNIETGKSIACEPAKNYAHQPSYNVTCKGNMSNLYTDTFVFGAPSRNQCSPDGIGQNNKIMTTKDVPPWG